MQEAGKKWCDDLVLVRAAVGGWQLGWLSGHKSDYTKVGDDVIGEIVIIHFYPSAISSAEPFPG